MMRSGEIVTAARRVSDLKAALIVVWPFILLALIFIGAYWWLPDRFLTQRYFNNIFFVRHTGRDIFGTLLLMLPVFRFSRRTLFLTAILAAGVGVVATVVNLFCKSFIDALYLADAFLSVAFGVIAGWAFRWQTLVSLAKYIFDPRIDWANHLFRFSIFIIFFGFAAFAVFIFARHFLNVNEWRDLFNPYWPGQPYMACLLWGWISSYTVGVRLTKANFEAE